MNKNQRIGLILILLSQVFWILIIIVPFLKIGLKEKTTASVVLFIASNIFWIGAPLLGKELIQKYQLWPKLKRWFRGKPE